MAILETVLLGMAANAAYGLSKAGASAIYDAVKTGRPDLIEKADIAVATGDDTALKDALAGALEVAAASGRVRIDGALLQATRLATFDHQGGQIHIGRTVISAPTLVTGGAQGATGQTTISGGTSMLSAGTSIEVGHGASIQITGGASIRQT